VIVAAIHVAVFLFPIQNHWLRGLGLTGRGHIMRYSKNGSDLLLPIGQSIPANFVMSPHGSALPPANSNSSFMHLNTLT
jgi:hypothetical protein